MERDARQCDTDSWNYWWLALQPWREVPDNPFKSE
jgi:hypothetical protein